MIHNAYRNHRRGAAPRLGNSQGNCPPGMVQNGTDCIDPASYAGICPPNQQAYGPSGPPSVMTFAQQQAGQFTCGPIAAAPAITSPAALISAQLPAPAPWPVAVATIPVTPAPVAPAPPPAPGEAFPYSTADLETIQNEMALYGDTWDNAQSILEALYASGIAPGTVTPAIAFNSLTAITAATATAPASVLTSPGAWPWYYWAALAGGGLFLMGRK